MVYSKSVGMEFGIENCAMFMMRIGKRNIMEGIEQTNEDKIRKLGERNLRNTWKYYKRTPSNKWR